MTAAHILSETGFDPTQIQDRVLVDPETVSVSRFPFWLDLILPSWIGAMTLPGAIWVRPRVLAIGGDQLRRLILHELVHVHQWREHGILGFLRHYVKDYLSARLRDRGGHRAAYRSIPFEDEAYTLASTFDDTTAT